MDAQPLVPAGAAGGLKKFSETWSTIFLVNASIVFLCSAVGLWRMLISVFVSPFDIVLFVYMLVFSLLLFIVDLSSSMSHPTMQELAQGVFKYCLFLCRFTGRGVFYMFLGTMLTGVLWDNDISPLIGFLAGAWLVVSGAVVLYSGVNLSRKLQQVKTALLNRGGPTGSICPPQGLRKEKFAEIADKMQGVKFTKEELQHITKAMSLSWHVDEVITKREFEHWMHDSAPLMI